MMINEILHFHLPFICSAIIGNVSRLGLLKINNLYSHSYTTNNTILYVNFTACIFMGFLQVFNFGSYDSNLQVCLTTGYCGTFSSFSTYIYEIFIHTVMRAHLFPNYGCTKKKRKLAQQNMKWLSTNFGSFLKYVLTILSIPLTIIMLVLSIVYRHNHHSYWTISSLFSIFGAYARYYLSKYNGKLRNKWSFLPIGTYLANIIATIILSILLILHQRYDSEYTKRLVLYSMIEGLTAAMSTMSTLMNEMNKLPLFRSSLYIFISVMSSYAMMIIIVGSYKWTNQLEAL
ncbi:unnamed protein product [Hanseniaspora opuntiae]